MYVKVRILTANGGHWLNIQKMRTCFKRVVFAMLFMAMALSLSAHDIEQDGIYYDVVSISELTCFSSSRSDKHGFLPFGNLSVGSNFQL